MIPNEPPGSMNKRSLPKQSSDFNCGPTALSYFLSLQGFYYTPKYIEDHLICTEEDGTSHGELVNFLFYRQFEFQHGIPDIWTLSLPMLVNYTTDEGEGHYGVITRMRLGYDAAPIVDIYDPEYGAVYTQDWNEFKRSWYSKRYGEKWGLWNLKKVKPPGREKLK